MSPFLPLVMALQAVPAPSATPPAKTEAEKVICKRIVETGSFIRAHKTCATRAQWARSSEANKAVAQRMVEDNSGRPTGQ